MFEILGAIMSTGISCYLRAVMMMFASAAVFSSREQDSTGVTVTSSSAVPVVIISNDSIATDVIKHATATQTIALFVELGYVATGFAALMTNPFAVETRTTSKDQYVVKRATCAVTVPTQLLVKECVDVSTTTSTEDLLVIPTPTTFLNIYAMQVGQGDCTIIQCPNGNIVVVDCGSTSVAGWSYQQVQTFLSDSINNVVAIVITHSDRDHFNYLPFKDWNSIQHIMHNQWKF